MLIDNKFIFISLPRCASTSFHISCVRHNLNIKFAKDSENNQYYDITLSNEDLIKSINHLHERIYELDISFGSGYDIISIKRNRHERFLSLWKFVVKSSKIYGDNVYNTINSLDIEDILWFDYTKLHKNRINLTIDLFLIKHNLIDKVDDYFKKLLFILWQPTSLWHNNDSRILWFDFDELNKLEDWVSDKLNQKFILENSNSSKNINTDMYLNDKFITLYNSMYDRYDLQKNNKTFI
jgi:hypothetical protein